MELQSTNHVLMVRPAEFYANPQTMETNSYQSGEEESVEAITSAMENEFDFFVQQLEKSGVKVTVFRGPEGSPDSIFPNNVFSMHNGGWACVYPMLSDNRDAEITEALLSFIKLQGKTVISYRDERKEGNILEGTGSLVLDRLNRTAYASLSPRTSEDMARQWAKENGYKVVTFSATDNGQQIYHTNVLMFIGSDVAGICLESIDEKDRQRVQAALQEAKSDVVILSREELHNMCGNALEIRNEDDEKILVMSDRAFNAYSDANMSILKKHYSTILHPDISTIEKYGGGSARCMLAEIF